MGETCANLAFDELPECDDARGLDVDAFLFNGFCAGLMDPGAKPPISAWWAATGDKEGGVSRRLE